MATNTYVALDTRTLTSATTSVTFSPIPQEYTDLVFVANVSGSGPQYARYRFNGDTGSNYSFTVLTGDGSTATSTRATSQTGLNMGLNNSTATNFLHVMNYSNTTTYKTVLARRGSASFGLDQYAGLWRSTAAITSIEFYSPNDFAIGSTFTVYGIASSDTLTKANGGMIAQDDTYTYHVFGATGSFIPKQTLTAEVLVVAGGGAGGAQGGGGGAGGLVYSSSVSLGSGTTYTATVGAGGVAASGVSGANGVASSLAGSGLTTISATGGGGGGSGISGQNNNGRNGGSGGGAGIGPSGTGGTAVSGQGSAGGGAPGGGGNYPGGGGGGASVAGGTPATNTSPAGNGGNGSSSYDAWGKATTRGEVVNGIYYFAGGGGGGIFYNPSADGTAGLGGYGGGTAGKGQAYTVLNAKTNTGGGGGGVGHSTLTLAGNGGSGVVIIRYPK